jgi:hypothetical protein
VRVLSRQWRSSGCVAIVSLVTIQGTHDYGRDIYTEADRNDDTLANLGPLRPLAGVWTSSDGADVHPVGPGSDTTGPVVDGSEQNTFVERYELQPIDPQTNGPQLFYGCGITPTSSSQVRSRRSTTKSGTGCGSPWLALFSLRSRYREARCC